jgi:hypothetical protein
MTRIGPRRELFSGAPDAEAFEAWARASALVAARASGVSFRVEESGLLARDTRGSSGGGRGVTDGCSGFGATEACSGFGSRGRSAGGGSEPDAAVAFAGSLDVASTTGAAIPMRVRLPGGTALAAATGARLFVAGSAGLVLGMVTGLSLGLSVT